jgi:ribosomal protein S8
MIIDIEKQNKTAIKWILNYYDLKKAYIERSANFSTLGATQYDGMPHGTSVGNPCANKIMTLLDLEYQKKWIMVIEKMEQTLSEKSRKYLEIRRDAASQISNNKGIGRPGWVDYTQVKYIEWFKYRYGKEIDAPTKQCMTGWMNKILDVTIRIAFNDKVLEI